MRIWSLASLALGPALLLATPASADGVTLKPSSPWNVDFAENRCRLARLFGEGEEKHLIFFEQYWPAERFGLTVAGPQFDGFRAFRETKLSFFEAQEPQTTKPFVGEIGEFGEAVIYPLVRIDTGTKNPNAGETPIALPALDTEMAEKAEHVTLRQGRREVTLMTGPMGDAFKVMNDCTHSFLPLWGLDLEQHRGLTRMVSLTNELELARRIQAKYPSSALRRGEQGIMRMRLIVSANGEIEECAIIKATTTEKLESPACSVFADAEFEPALDAQGQPMRSYYTASITYQMGR